MEMHIYLDALLGQNSPTTAAKNQNIDLHCTVMCICTYCNSICLVGCILKLLWRPIKWYMLRCIGQTEIGRKAIHINMSTTLMTCINIIIVSHDVHGAGLIAFSTCIKTEYSQQLDIILF